MVELVVLYWLHIHQKAIAVSILITAATFAIANAQRHAVDEIVEFHAKEVYAFTEGMDLPMGLTPNHIRVSPEYKAAKGKLDRAMSVLKAWNRYIVKNWPKENAAFYKAKREARRANLSN